MPFAFNQGSVDSKDGTSQDIEDHSSHASTETSPTAKDGMSDCTAIDSNYDLEARARKGATNTPRQRPTFLARIRAYKPSKETSYNAILGVSDGMTVPFALTASLAGVTDAKLVMLAGVAELIAGAISMGAGGILGRMNEAEEQKARTRAVAGLLKRNPSNLGPVLTETFSPHLSAHVLSPMVDELASKSLTEQLDFLLRFTSAPESPSYSAESSKCTLFAALKPGFVLGISYFAGILALIPYFIFRNVQTALYVSIGISTFVLTIFGWIKTGKTVEWGFRRCLRGALEMVGVVALAAGASYVIIKWIDGGLP